MQDDSSQENKKETQGTNIKRYVVLHRYTVYYARYDKLITHTHAQTVRRTNIGFPLCANECCACNVIISFFTLVYFTFLSSFTYTNHLFRLALELSSYFFLSNCMGTNSLTHIKSLFNENNNNIKRDEKRIKQMKGMETN